MFIYPNDNNSKTPSDWVEAEEVDDDDDEVDYDPNKPIMYLRRVEGVELIWCKFRNRFLPQSKSEEE
ncbi:hypothetical protein [Kamptonema sp. UHCC 0994]|uniref:hypothetical protein n=1 Tax=Kamptonema sp. UHCC 0994 TaxID=3031329 RepID=UPI0023BA5DDB|nr:hypothetical protein [Kamptonema sp. UHCC 0994]MDF0556570.1 hypothetical protein [Kamptonema sp. UHCC 0994]